MFTVCVGFVFRSKYVQFPIICPLQYSKNINTVEVDPYSDLLYICIVKPKNIFHYNELFKIAGERTSKRREKKSEKIGKRTKVGKYIRRCTVHCDFFHGVLVYLIQLQWRLINCLSCRNKNVEK